MFLILKLPRTGSTMFGAVLNSHPNICCRNEILNHLMTATTDEKVAYLKDYFFGSLKQSEVNGGQIIGGTINPFKYQLTASDIRKGIHRTRLSLGLIAKVLAGKTSSADIVLLLRNNILKQALSLYLALDRNKFESSLDQIKDQGARGKRIFDIPRLEKLTMNLERESRKLAEVAHTLSSTHLRVSYEELTEHPQQVYASVFSHVGAPPVDVTFDFSGGYKKILSDDVRDVVVNYDRLHDSATLRRYL